VQVLPLLSKCSHIFGIPITPKMISNIWSQAGVAVFVLAQFFFFQKDLFTMEFLPHRLSSNV